MHPLLASVAFAEKSKSCQPLKEHAVTPSLHHHQAVSTNRPRLPALAPELIESRNRPVAEVAPSPLYAKVLAKLRSVETILAGASHLQGAGESYGRLLYMTSERLLPVIQLLKGMQPSIKALSKAEERLFDLMSMLDGAISLLDGKQAHDLPAMREIACRAKALLDEAATEMGA